MNGWWALTFSVTPPLTPTRKHLSLASDPTLLFQHPQLFFSAFFGGFEFCSSFKFTGKSV